MTVAARSETRPAPASWSSLFVRRVQERKRHRKVRWKRKKMATVTRARQTALLRTREHRPARAQRPLRFGCALVCEVQLSAQSAAKRPSPAVSPKREHAKVSWCSSSCSHRLFRRVQVGRRHRNRRWLLQQPLPAKWMTSNTRLACSVLSRTLFLGTGSRRRPT